MKLRDSKFTLTFAAAAVAYALGVAPAIAQQGGAQGAQQQGSQPSSQQQRSQQPGSQQQGAQQSQGGAQQQDSQRTQQSGQSGQQQGQAASTQQRGGDSQLDEVVRMHSELETFVEALKTAGLTESLAGGTDYTIFAPTNAAFESMEQDVSELLKPENREQLVSLLRAHIVADDVDQQRARQLTAAQTLDGDTIELSMENDKLMVDDASVETADIEVEGANLRIHTIDQVLGQGVQSASAPDRRNRG